MDCESGKGAKKRQLSYENCRYHNRLHKDPLKIRCLIEFYLFSLLLVMRTRIAGRTVVKAVFTA